MKAIYLGWAVAYDESETMLHWIEESPQRIEIMRNSQNLALQEPRDGRRAKTTILCRFPSSDWDFPEIGAGMHLAVEIEYKDPPSRDGFSSRLLIDCKVEDMRHMAPHPHDVRRVVLSYAGTMPARPSSASYILWGWKSEWFRTTQYRRYAEFNYPDIAVAEREHPGNWANFRFDASPNFSSGIEISDGRTDINIKPKGDGVLVNGIPLSWFGLERLVTILSRHLIFRGKKSGYSYRQIIEANATANIAVPVISSVLRLNQGHLENCNTPIGNGVSVPGHHTYMAAKHEGSERGDTLRFSMDDQSDAEIHVDWRIQDELRYLFHNRTDQPVLLQIGIF